MLEEAMSGQYLNKSYIPECGAPPNTAKPDAAVTERTLKVSSPIDLLLLLYGVSLVEK
jgi:hypothetical protein